MISTTDILVSTHSVGVLTLDGPGAKGEGGSYDPRLVIPTMIRMASQAREKQLAVTELTWSAADSAVANKSSVDRRVAPLRAPLNQSRAQVLVNE